MSLVKSRVRSKPAAASPAGVLGRARQSWAGWADSAPLRESELQRFIALAVLYRTLAFIPVIPITIDALSEVRRHSGLFLMVVGVVVSANIGLIILTLRRRAAWFADSVHLRVVDLAAVVALNAWFSFLLTDGTLFEPYRDFFWVYVIGSVVLWTGVRQARMGLALVALTVPLQLLMMLLNGVGPGQVSISTFFLREAWVVVAFLVGMLVVGVARDAGGMAEEQGRLAGIEAERVRALREMHDTVLQTLEGIALRAHQPAGDPAVLLQVIGAEARRQAAQVRVLLRQDQGALGNLYSEIEGVLAEIEGRGAILPHFVPVGPAPTLPARIREALVGAIGEALRNAERHSDARRLTVYIETTGMLVRVEVRDDGRGFDEGAIPPGSFGIANSIRDRLSEVKGRAKLETSPGGGTTWALFVPVDDGLGKRRPPQK